MTRTYNYFVFTIFNFVDTSDVQGDYSLVVFCAEFNCLFSSDEQFFVFCCQSERLTDIKL